MAQNSQVINFSNLKKNSDTWELCDISPLAISMLSLSTNSFAALVVQNQIVEQSLKRLD